MLDRHSRKKLDTCTQCTQILRRNFIKPWEWRVTQIMETMQKVSLFSILLDDACLHLPCHCFSRCRYGKKTNLSFRSEIWPEFYYFQRTNILNIIWSRESSAVRGGPWNARSIREMYDSRGQSIFSDQVVLSFKNMNLCMLRKCVGGGDRFSEKAANMSQNMLIENGFNHFNASKLSY